MFHEPSLVTQEWRWKQHLSPLSQDRNLKPKQSLGLIQYHAKKTWWKMEL